MKINAGKYQSVEKILYLANQDKMLNVNINEKADTDLNNRVRSLLANKSLELVKTTSKDYYYKTTEKGKIELLKKQIKTRKGLGKSTDLHEYELDQLLSK
tara:strand:+ start:26548 stop:26847 length:300 start_codon:yes stop_codon:yes gene_type:complete